MKGLENGAPDPESSSGGSPDVSDVPLPGGIDASLNQETQQEKVPPLAQSKRYEIDDLFLAVQYRSDPQKAIRILSSKLETAVKEFGLKDPFVGQDSYRLGIAYLKDGQLGKAVEFFKTAVEADPLPANDPNDLLSVARAMEFSELQKAKIQMRIAEVDFDQRNFKESLPNYEAALARYERLKPRKLDPATEGQIGLAYREYAMALALAGAEKNKIDRAIELSTNLLADTLRRKIPELNRDSK